MVNNQVIGQKDDGVHYLEFLTMLKDKLGEKSVSIAAPASYWYLKAFPIEKISKVIDYIVYMTYDLHGQWDYGNPNAFDSCASGKCIRSYSLSIILKCAHHVLTNLPSKSYRDDQCTCHEYVATQRQVCRANFKAVTKAGVANNKIFVGEASYGRSFHMRDPSCRGSHCDSTGSRAKSDARPGRCTDTSGYIAYAELTELLSTGDNIETFHDGQSNTDVMLHEGGSAMSSGAIRICSLVMEEAFVG